MERVDPSLIAVRPHVPAHAEWSGGVDLSTGREPGAIDGRSHAAALIEDEEEGPTPEPVELQERPFPTRSEHFHARFRDTILRFEDLIREKCGQGVETLLEDVGDLIRSKLGPRAQDVLPAVDLDANPRLASWIDQHIREADRKYLKQALRRAVNPTTAGLRNWLIKDSLKAVHLASEGMPDAERGARSTVFSPCLCPAAAASGGSSPGTLRSSAASVMTPHSVTAAISSTSWAACTTWSKAGICTSAEPLTGSGRRSCAGSNESSTDQSAQLETFARIYEQQAPAP